jgi:hypothetical protein
VSSRASGNRAPPHGGGVSRGVFPLRATTTAADSPRDCASEQTKLDRAETDASSVLLAEIDVGDL